jgi:hypothetical protein
VGKKFLTAAQKEVVAKKAAEVLEEAGGYLRDNELVERIYKKCPELAAYSLWKGIEKARQESLIVRVKRKGYTVNLSPAESETSLLEQAVVSEERGRESEYYQHVANWFTKQGNCLAVFKKGHEWGMPDVSVVKGSSSLYLDDIELITVEVKRGNATPYDLMQAYGYSKLAHRCYLASDIEAKLGPLREQAEKIGIGLLLIDPKKPDDIKELLSPPRSEPSTTSLQDHLARAFNLVSCTLCGTYFKREKNRTKILLRERPTAMDRPQKTKVTRFICEQCYNLFLYGKEMEVWKG